MLGPEYFRKLFGPARTPAARAAARLAPLLTTLVTALAGCGAPPPVAPPPPPFDLAELLPTDAPLTGVVRPGPLGRHLAAHLPAAAEHPALRPLAVGALVGLGLDPEGPVWVALRGGPLFAVRRAADDAERLLAAPGQGAADVDPVIAEPVEAAGAPADEAVGADDPAFAPEPGAAEPSAPALAQWFAVTPLPPAWLHLRLAGRAGAAVDPVPALSAAHGAVQSAALDGPPETLAAALGVEPAALAALDLDAPGLVVHRLLDAPHPTLVVTRRRGDRLVVDYIWDWELGPHALLDALAALPERRAPDPAAVAVPPDHRLMHPLAAEELARLRLDHARATDTAHLLGDVAALQGVLGQGRLPVPPLDALRADRRLAERPRRLMAPAADAFVATGLVVVRDPAGEAGEAADDGAAAGAIERLRARLTLDYAPRAQALGALRDGRPPVDHAAAADAAPLVATLALAPAAATPTLSAHLHPPDRGLAAHLDDALTCGLPCLPALWTTPLAHARDPAALAARLADRAPLATALADATGAAIAIGREIAAAIGYAPPATVARAAWAPLELPTRWLVGDAATLVVGQGPSADRLAAAARSTVTTDASALRFTVRPPYTRGRIDGTLTFERDALALDAVLHPPAP